MTEEPTSQDKLRDVVKSLRDKANMQASCHSVLSDRYNRAHTILMSVVLFLSTFLVGITFISDQFVQATVGVQPDILRWITGLTSILIFAAGLLLSQWNFAGKAVDHRAAVRHYFAVVNRARYLLDSGEDVTERMVNELRSEYEHTEALPKIPESQFLKLKQHHLRKVAISKELDRTPHASLRQIRKRLQEREQQSQAGVDESNAQEA